ncbi:MAG: GntR family transcriptional regulator [Bacillota bacterium]|nr:GntR family transcriptional regulator [Bacillota bacterium]MDI7249125.1 GntR family transcriptional regulator [Bacillota bacterium]
MSEAIVEQLRERIIRGVLKEGDRLPPERELAEMFGVGRASVREAMRALMAMGLIRRGRDGTYVSLPKPSADGLAWQLLAKRATLRELFETRRMFEVGLAALAAERATAEDVEELEAALRTDDGRLESFIKSDEAFHTALASAANNVVLYELYLAVKDIIFSSHQVYRSASEAGQAEKVAAILEMARRDHAAILEAVRKQDQSAAGEAMACHLRKLEELLPELINNGAGVAAVMNRDS